MELAKAGFTYTLEHLDANRRIKSVEVVKNLMPTVGVTYLLSAGFLGASQFSTWYLGVYEASRTPIAADTMTTLLADCVESTAYTVTSGQRPALTLPAVSAGAIVTVAPNIVELDFISAATISGAFITSGIIRGNTAGLLISAVRFTSPKVMAIGETLKVPVGFALISA